MSISFNWIWLVILYNILLTVASSINHDEPECPTILRDNYSNCSHDSPDFFARGKTMEEICEESMKKPSSHKEHCHNYQICNKTFNLSIFHNQLFAIAMKDIVLNMLNDCCGFCTKCRVGQDLEHITHVKPPSSNNADIIFPVLGLNSADKLYSYYFLPSFEVPSSYYFTLKQSNKEMVIKLIVACTNMWPLIIISLLMALIAGFITWSMETAGNEEEFPRPFLIGLFDGFWWSFISMTTVGYGDKCPKSYLGRMFAVIWIFIGINVCAAFTAALTNEIMTFRSFTNTDMTGKTVGILKQRLHDSTIVAQHGGVVMEGKQTKTVLAIGELIVMLEGKQIDGFLMNRNTYYFFTRRLKEEKYKKLALAISEIDLVKTEKFLKGEKLSCGILVKSKDDFDFFKSYLKNNALSLQSCNSIKLNYRRTNNNEDDINLFSPKGGVFETFFFVSLTTLGIVFTFGFFYELRRHYKNKRTWLHKTVQTTLREMGKLNISVTGVSVQNTDTERNPRRREECT